MICTEKSCYTGFVQPVHGVPFFFGLMKLNGLGYWNSCLRNFGSKGGRYLEMNTNCSKVKTVRRKCKNDSKLHLVSLIISGFSFLG